MLIFVLSQYYLKWVALFGHYVWLREAIWRKNLLPFGIFPKGGGVMSESKSFEELFCSVHVWTFFQKGGGVAWFQTFWGTFLLVFGNFSERGGGNLIPKLLRNFFAWVWTFFRKRGGVAWFQRWWGTFFCFGLDIFQGKWGRMTNI